MSIHHRIYRGDGWYRILIPSAGVGVLFKGATYSSSPKAILTDAVAETPLLGEEEVLSVPLHTGELRLLLDLMIEILDPWVRVCDLIKPCQGDEYGIEGMSVRDDAVSPRSG